MILKGSQRAGAKQLAAHLLKTEDNDHVEVHELRGFVADTLHGALTEAYAVSRGTRCKQFLFSLSLNPPERAQVTDREFKAAIRDVEHALGLVGQPRAIVFHEKDGRRHAHCVWSRIDVRSMTAINLPHYKLKLRDVSRELYLKHGWRMPVGLVDSQARDPANFTRAEWQQSKRAGHDPKMLKKLFQDCWAISDSGDSFAKALEERGFYLARGDRRGVVAVDYQGEVYAVARLLGVRTKEVTARLGDPAALPALDATRSRIAARMTPVVRRFVTEAKANLKKQTAALAFRKSEIVQRHRAQRAALQDRQEARRDPENRARAARLPRGLWGLWARLTGKYRRIRTQNEREAYQAYLRDQAEKQRLIAEHRHERLALQTEIRAVRERQGAELLNLNRDVVRYMTMAAERNTAVKERFRDTDRQHSREQSPARIRTRGRTRRRSRGPSPDNDQGT